MLKPQATLAVWTPIMTKGRRHIGFGWINQDQTITLRLDELPADGKICVSTEDFQPLRWWQRLVPYRN